MASLDDVLASLPPEHRALVDSLGAAHIEIERLRRGIQTYLDGNHEPRIRKLDKCKHGIYGYEICGNCIDEHFQKLLDNQQSAEDK